MPNYGKVQEIKFLHNEEEINNYLKEGWVIIIPPFVGLRRINDGRDDKYEPIDIPYRQVVLGKM